MGGKKGKKGKSSKKRSSAPQSDSPGKTHPHNAVALLDEDLLRCFWPQERGAHSQKT